MCSHMQFQFASSRPIAVSSPFLEDIESVDEDTHHKGGVKIGETADCPFEELKADLQAFPEGKIWTFINRGSKPKLINKRTILERTVRQLHLIHSDDKRQPHLVENAACIEHV